MQRGWVGRKDAAFSRWKSDQWELRPGGGGAATASRIVAVRPLKHMVAGPSSARQKPRTEGWATKPSKASERSSRGPEAQRPLSPISPTPSPVRCSGRRSPSPGT